MRLLLIELHGMDVSCINDMKFLRSVAKPKVFKTYTGLAETPIYKKEANITTIFGMVHPDYGMPIFSVY